MCVWVKLWYPAVDMIARCQSYLLHGIDALPCEVEVDIADLTSGDGEFGSEGGGGPKELVVGLPDAAVKESLQRVKAALANSGYAFPQGRTVVNLAPADVRKEGPLYDLPIAVGILLARGVISEKAGGVSMGKAGKGRPSVAVLRQAGAKSGVGGRGASSPPPDEGTLEADLAALDASEPLPQETPDVRRYLIAGELALDGRVRPVKGVIQMAALARANGFAGVIVPAQNAAEASVVPGIEAIGVSSLVEVVGLLTGRLEITPHPPVDIAALLQQAVTDVDFADVRGQEAVKRAIVVAAAGGHNLLMLGPAGTGKSMMAKALAGVLPPLHPDEAIEITRIYSAAGMLQPGTGLVSMRPVRTPHHTASGAAVIGGGQVPKPGEVSLAHRGVLFLDELPEFPRDVLETLRQPLEDHVVTIARSHSAVRFPANFMLVAAMNPTPRGDLPTDEVGRRAMDKYLAKLSGPLIDRIDIHVEAPAVPFKQLAAGKDGPRGTSSAAMRAQVLAARAVQAKRQGTSVPNARLPGKKLDELAPMTEPAKAILGAAITELGLSARAYDKLRRVSRTIADLDGSEVIQPQHVSEAVSYRLLDRKV